MSSTFKRIEYMCTYCGKKETRSPSMGRPQPGKCPRKNGDKPHSWVINKRLGWIIIDFIITKFFQAFLFIIYGLSSFISKLILTIFNHTN